MPEPLSSEERARMLDKLDEIASLLMASAAPIEVDVARSPEDLIATYRLRHDFLISTGCTDCGQMAGGVEKDVYDDRALHLAAKYDGSVMGTIRLVFPQEGGLLPVEAHFGIRIEPIGEVVEPGRLVVAPEFRGDRHRVSGALLGRSWIEMRSRGYYICGGAASRKLISVYEIMGFTIEVLGKPLVYGGQERFPCRWALSVPQPQSWR
jgi:N-acyl-L-homoserine lactone synthetase